MLAAVFKEKKKKQFLREAGHMNSKGYDTQVKCKNCQKYSF